MLKCMRRTRRASPGYCRFLIVCVLYSFVVNLCWWHVRLRLLRRLEKRMSCSFSSSLGSRAIYTQLSSSLRNIHPMKMKVHQSICTWQRAALADVKRMRQSHDRALGRLPSKSDACTLIIWAYVEPRMIASLTN